MSTYNYKQKPNEEEFDDYMQELLEWQKIYSPRDYLRAIQAGVTECDPHWLEDMGYEIADIDDTLSMGEERRC